MASLEKPRKLEDTVGKMRTLRGGTVGKRRKSLKKWHEMAERNIAASILKKFRLRSSTESSVRWGSEQDSLQADEE
jgi:hypothetical protein